MQCTHCGKNLTPDEMRGEACRYCGTVLPHQAKAMAKAAMVKELLNDADGDGTPDVFQAMGGGMGAGVNVSVGTDAASALTPEVKKLLEQKGVDLSGKVVVSHSSTSFTTSSSGEMPAHAAKVLEDMGLSGFAGSGAAAFKLGMQVLVQWDDGNRYPGEVSGLFEGACEVTLGDGRTLKVENRYLHPA